MDYAVPRLRGALLLTLACAACSFNTQPLFEPHDAGFGQAQHGESTDAQTELGKSTQPPNAIEIDDAGPLDAGAGADASEPPPVTNSDAAAPGEMTTTMMGACTPNAVRCENDTLSSCDAAGSATTRTACRFGCNRAADGCNECPPSTRDCIGTSVLLHCDENGKPTPEMCDVACAAGACTKCVPGASSCRGKELTVCSMDGQTETTKTCDRGCGSGNSACAGRTLLPSNLSADTCHDASTQDREFAQNTELDTDGECTEVVMQGSGQPEICVLKYRDLRVREGVVVQAHGKRALALVATGQMRIEGTLSVSAHGSMAGAGIALGTSGVGHDAIGRLMATTMPTNPLLELPAQAAGGGGGYSVRGARGGGAPGDCGQGVLCAESGQGGAMYGAEQLSPLQGGSAGGNNSASVVSSRRGQPGAGGGALQLVACAQLELGASSILAANGGGGSGGNPGTMDSSSETPGGGTGGGSGGALLIQAAALKVQAGARVVANGGGGGGGATRMAAGGASGFVPGGAGQDGQPSTEQALGGSGAGMSQPGGVGGTAMKPTAGASVMGPGMGQAAGGGGGSAGRIRLDADPMARDTQGLVVSPALSVGDATFE